MSTDSRPGWYDRTFSRLVDLVLSDGVAGTWRARTGRAASGVVLELGFGSGRNLAYYPESVTEVWAVDPSDAAWERASERIAAFGRPVRRVGTDAARLELSDASVDTIVSTWTLCSIPDLTSALTEAHRVLRPGGWFHFTEHALAPDRGTARVQRAIQPAWGRLAGGCHVDRDLPTEIASAGWRLEALDKGYVFPLWPARPWTWFVTGQAA